MHIQLSTAFQQELILLARECEMTPERFCAEVIENAIADRRLRSIVETGTPGVVDSGGPGRPKRVFDISAAIELRQQGRTLEQIAQHVGVSYSTVYNALRKAGVSKPAPRPGPGN